MTFPAPSSSRAGGAPSSPSSAAAKIRHRRIMITMRSGQVSGETGRMTVPLDTPVSVVVTSDAADEIHVHGYGLKAEIPPGGAGTVSFTATVSGVFEVELDDSKLPLLQLQVS